MGVTGAEVRQLELVRLLSRDEPQQRESTEHDSRQRHETDDGEQLGGLVTMAPHMLAVGTGLGPGVVRAGRVIWPRTLIAADLHG